MALFQRSEIWEVVPALERSRVTDVAPDTALLTLPLTLRIGARDPGPEICAFSSMCWCVRKPEGWANRRPVHDGGQRAVIERSRRIAKLWVAFELTGAIEETPGSPSRRSAPPRMTRGCFSVIPSRRRESAEGEGDPRPSGGSRLIHTGQP
jgi:hypothetical protein